MGMRQVLEGLSPEEIALRVLGKSSISANPEPTYQCPKCKDSGMVAVGSEDGIERMAPCECAERLRMERIVAKSGISEAFRECTFEKFRAWDPRVAQARGVAEAYSLAFSGIEKDRQNSLALIGEVGSGKTMLGVCVLNALTVRGISVLYAPYRDMVLELKGNVLDDYAYQQALEKYTRPRVLFIDDLYKGHTDKDPKYVYDVINARYLVKRAVIVTSEYQADALMEIDAAVGSRIIEMCRDYIYELCGGGLNYRLRGL